MQNVRVLVWKKPATDTTGTKMCARYMHSPAVFDTGYPYEANDPYLHTLHLMCGENAVIDPDWDSSNGDRIYKVRADSIAADLPA